MRFKIDENLPPDVADVLRQAGHEAFMVYDQGLRSHTDPQVIAVCQAESLALPVTGKLWIVDEARIRIRQVGEVPL